MDDATMDVEVPTNEEVIAQAFDPLRTRLQQIREQFDGDGDSEACYNALEEFLNRVDDLYGEFFDDAQNLMSEVREDTTEGDEVEGDEAADEEEKA